MKARFRARPPCCNPRPQPAVSLQLKGLEESIGLQLFNRMLGGFTLTEAGAALLPLAHRTVSSSADFRTAAYCCVNCSGQRYASARSWIPNFIWLGLFVRSLPLSPSKKTVVFLRYGMSDDVLAQIGRGELDVGYYVDATPPECLASGILPERAIDDGKFQLTALMRYDYRVIAPREWSDKVLGKDWADLVDLPWIATPRDSAPRRLVDDVFRAVGSTQSIAFRRSGSTYDQSSSEPATASASPAEFVLDRMGGDGISSIADDWLGTSDLVSACLTSRRRRASDLAGVLRDAGRIGALAPGGAAPAPIEAARSRKSARG